MITIPLSHRLPGVRRQETSPNAHLIEALDALALRGDPLIHLQDRDARATLSGWFELRRDVDAWRSRIVHIALREPGVEVGALCDDLLTVFRAMRGDARPQGEVASMARASTEDALGQMIDFADAHRLDVVVGHAECLSAPARHALSRALVAHVHAARWFWLWEGDGAEALDVEGAVVRGERQDEALDEEAWRLLMVLSHQDYAIVERDALAALGLSTKTSTWLRERGLVEQRPSGLSLTERGAEVQASRRGLKLGQRDATTLRVFVRDLQEIGGAQEDEVARHFDAFRCAMSHRLIEEVEAILARSFEAFRRADLLMDVYVRLLDANEPRLRTWLFRASCYMSDFDRAESLRWREELDLEDAMYWIYLLLNRGRYEQLEEMAQGLLTRHEEEGMSQETRMCCEQVRLLLARSFLQTNRHAEAQAMLSPVLHTSDRWMRINARFVQIRAMAYAGEIMEGRALLPSLVAEVESLTLAEQRKWALFMIQTCYIL